MPLLSICIPTYNRASFLRVMLETLLPQAAEVGDEGEVWVLDNASNDETAEVAVEAKSLGPMRYHRQTSNLGPIRNVVHGPCHLATGEFTWVLGDHNLLRPGALRRVLDTLRAHRDLDTFCANFRCATYPEHWPETASGGYDGDHAYVANEAIEEGPVTHWSDHIRGNSALCTQLYAHIVRTAIWREFWAGRDLPESHTTGISTYPHTWMLASTVFDRPSHRIADPVLTIFNGAQSWGDPETRARVYFQGLPELVRLYRQQGLPAAQLAEAEKFNRVQGRVVMLELLRSSGVKPWRTLSRLLGKTARQNIYLWPVLLGAFLESGTTCFSRGLLETGERARRWHAYLFHHCRPARWWRAHGGNAANRS